MLRNVIGYLGSKIGSLAVMGGVDEYLHLAILGIIGQAVVVQQAGAHPLRPAPLKPARS
jgi:hypothetical protein